MAGVNGRICTFVGAERHTDPHGNWRMGGGLTLEHRQHPLRISTNTGGDFAKNLDFSMSREELRTSGIQVLMESDLFCLPRLVDLWEGRDRHLYYLGSESNRCFTHLVVVRTK